MMTRRRLPKAEVKRRRIDDETADKERSMKLEQEGGLIDLLPGIPNEVTTQVISLRLSWMSFHALRSVSRAWQDAVRSHEMYDARDRNHSTEAVAILNHIVTRHINAIALYSLKDKMCYQLPLIPDLTNGIPRSCECVTLDGKIYLLGGVKNSDSRHGIAKAYVLDLTGQRQWKRCADMHERRYRFGCGVIHGKIYVFGGISLGEPVFGSEVYDPKLDAWTEIKSMMARSWKLDHEVGTVGDELLAYSGRLRVFEVYNPLANTWRRPASGFERHPEESWFMVEDKLHIMCRCGIFVIDIERESRTLVHECQYKIERLVSQFHGQPVAILAHRVLAMDDELLAKCNWPEWSPCGKHVNAVTGLVQSSGFSIKDEVVVWEKAHTHLSLGGLDSPFMCQLRL